MNITTDFLVYKEGVYHKTKDQIKFKGAHVVKILGWAKHEQKGESYWIIQNVWGYDWGEKGYAMVAMGETKLDDFALGHTVYPLPMVEYYAQQTKETAAKKEAEQQAAAE